MKKVGLATVWLDGCSGCHMSLLDMDEAILAVAKKVDMVYGPLVDAQEFPKAVDVTLVEGAINKGIEVQIDESGDDFHCTGVLYSMTQAKARPYKPAGEWNTLEITMKGQRTTVTLNGVQVTDYDGVAAVPAKKSVYEPDRGPRPDTGYIAIQHHGGAASVSFKEISLR